MSAVTMKTSAHTDTYHALDRTGQHAVCRKNLKPATWTSLLDSDEAMERSATFIQSGDTFKRSCSVSRVNCLACQRKLAQELAYAVGTANAWQAVLLGLAERQNRPVAVVSLRSIGVAWDMVMAGYMEQVGTEYALTALGLRAAGVVRAAEAQAHRWNDTLRGLAKIPGMFAAIKDAREQAAAEELVQAGYCTLLSGGMARLILTHEGVKAAGLHLEWLSGAVGAEGRSALLQWVTRGAEAMPIRHQSELARHGLATVSAEGGHVLTGLAYRVASYLRSPEQEYTGR